MRRFNHVFLAALLVSLLAIPAFAATAKKYQVTGVISALTDDVVTITKADGEKFEINRDPKETGGDLKVGERVTVMYTMTAASIEAKAPTSRPAHATPAK